MLPPILEVYVLWHPADDAAGRPLMDRLVAHFHGNAYSGLLGGAIEVFTRSQGWHNAAGAPRPLPLPGPGSSVDVPATCGLSGKTLGELDFRRDFGVTVIGIERGSEQIRTLTATTTVESSDRLIVAGCQKAVDRLHAALLAACAID